MYLCNILFSFFSLLLRGALPGRGPRAAAHRRLVRLRDGDLRVPQHAAGARLPKGDGRRDEARHAQDEQGTPQDEAGAQPVHDAPQPLEVPRGTE